MSKRLARLAALLARDCHVKIMLEVHDATGEDPIHAEALVHEVEIPAGLPRDQRIERVKHAMGQIATALTAAMSVREKSQT